MANLMIDDIADDVIAIQQDLGRMKWTDISFDLQYYIALPQIMRKRRVGFSGGRGPKWQLRHTRTGNARMVGLHSVDNANFDDQLATAEAPWRHAETKYVMERREILMDRNEYRIVDMVKVRRTGALGDFAELMEEEFFEKPAASTDTLNAFGLPYWCVQNASEGFYGGDPSGFAAGAGGKLVADYPNWRNYTGQYAVVSIDDLISMMDKAAYKINFRSPVKNMPDYNTGDQYQVLTTYSTRRTMRELADTRNDNLGRDVNAGDVRFNRNQVLAVPYLDANTTTNPVYMINWGVFKCIFLRGDYMHEEKPEKAPSSHNSLVVYIDNTFQYVCYDRRRLAVFYI